MALVFEAETDAESFNVIVTSDGAGVSTYNAAAWLVILQDIENYLASQSNRTPISLSGSNVTHWGGTLSTDKWTEHVERIQRERNALSGSGK